MNEETQVQPAPALGEREAFEAWVKTFNNMPAALFRDERDRYLDDWIQCRWLGWQAALATRPAQTEQQPVEVMRFQMKHPFSGETHTVELTREEVADGLEDTLYEKLGPLVCSCNGDVDHECGDYICDFCLTPGAPITQPDQTAAAVLEGYANLLRRARTFVDAWDDDSQEFMDLCGDIDNALGAAAPSPEVVERDGWQPIETAPRDGTMIWLFEPHTQVGFMFAGCTDIDGVWRNNLDMLEQKPTHWMPLPAAPALSAQGEAESASDEIPDFTPGSGNKARRRAEAIKQSLSAENQRVTPIEPLRAPHPLESAQGEGEGHE